MHQGQVGNSTTIITEKQVITSIDPPQIVTMWHKLFHPIDEICSFPPVIVSIIKSLQTHYRMV